MSTGIPQDTRFEVLEHYYAQLEKQSKFHCYERNDALACHDLAHFYESKQKKNLLAFEEYKKNCFDRKYGPSCLNYGRLLFKGAYQVEKNIPEALKAFKQGCEVKRYSGEACHIVGQYILPKVEVPEAVPVLGRRNVKKAVQMFARGCEGDFRDSCAFASTHYSEGIEGHLKPNKELAFKYAEKGCELNDYLSCKNAAEACKEGIGTEKNERRANFFQAKADALKPTTRAKRLSKK